MTLPYAGLVSVIMPTYNRSALIGRAIRSVIEQSYPHWELIVVDDASTDGTGATVAQFDDRRIHYLRLPINCGHPSRPRNIGWLLARGVYLAYIDDDNAWRPAHLERLVAACVANPAAARAYGGRRIHREDGSTEDVVGPERNIDTGDGLHRRDVDQLLPEMWTETNYTNEDKEFWERLRQRHPVGMIDVPEVLSDYYAHRGNRFSNHWMNFRRYDHEYYRREAARPETTARHQAQVDLVAQLAPSRVLDVGCGPGEVVGKLRARAVDAWGVDPAPQAATLQATRDRFVRAPADRMPFPSSSFDLVLCADVLAHIPEPFVLRSLRELVRVCDGHLALAIDCFDATRPGHLTVRPRAWWLGQLAQAGAQPDPIVTHLLGSPPDDRLEWIVCRPSRPAAPSEQPLQALVAG